MRDSLRHEVNKNTLGYREKKNEMDQKVSLLESFCHVINSSETKLQQLKSDYETALKSRNNTAIQLLERQEELCVLYEKINIHASFIKKGEFSLRQKEEEIRISKLAIQELKREINLLKKKEPIQQDQVEEIKKLRQDLEGAKRTVTDLSNQLESPMNSQRSRHLEGRDPNEIELEKKLRSLEEKIADKEEVLLEKDLILDEITKLTIRLKEQTKENQKIAIDTNQKINKIQIQLKDINTSMMALVSELSLSQAQSIQFENEKSEKIKVLEEATDRYSKGEVPLPEFEYEYMRGEKQKQIRHEQFLKSRAEVQEEYVDEMKILNLFILKILGISVTILFKRVLMRISYNMICLYPSHTVILHHLNRQSQEVI